MRALTYTENGGPEVLHVAAMPEPHAGPGQIRVKVAAAERQPDRLEADRRLHARQRGDHRAPPCPASTPPAWSTRSGEGVTGVAVG